MLDGLDQEPETGRVRRVQVGRDKDPPPKKTSTAEQESIPTRLRVLAHLRTSKPTHLPRSILIGGIPNGIGVFRIPGILI